MSKEKGKEPSLKEAYEELEAITQQLEQGDVDLEQGVAKFERGLALSRILKKKLQKIQKKITLIKNDFDAPEEE